ncbi:MAG TPA: sulfurtransferase-like selenium metabolism protein YedF [Syntrophales bacterium]|nr:sulfurtransferase-like selenium metabolism protein YedF [Syntrophales bacterium]HPQ43198.1 sulfurtransferase-like selenium metabolism protein YedF [Syntrophales bacterium]
MIYEIDARGLACPQPVIMTKKTIESGKDCVVIVDNEAARDNVCRMATNLGCETDVEEREGYFRIRVTRGTARKEKKSVAPATGPTVVVFPCDRMGKGDDELGNILIRGFLHTLGEISPKPDVMIFFNAGVKLTTEGSDVIEDLRALEGEGVKILVCGTCLDFFGLKDRLQAGIISNMYDIAETMLSAGKVVRI